MRQNPLKASKRISASSIVPALSSSLTVVLLVLSNPKQLFDGKYNLALIYTRSVSSHSRVTGTVYFLLPNHHLPSLKPPYSDALEVLFFLSRTVVVVLLEPRFEIAIKETLGWFRRSGRYKFELPLCSTAGKFEFFRFRMGWDGMGWDGMLMEMSFNVLECEDNAAAVVIFFHDLKVEDYYFIWFHDILAYCRICVWNASDGSLVHSLAGHTESERKRYRREGEENRTVELRTKRLCSQVTDGDLAPNYWMTEGGYATSYCLLLRFRLGYVTIGSTCRIVKGGNCWIVREEKKLENLELSMRGLETRMEAVRKGLQELLRRMEERARQLEENSDGSQAYVNGKKEDQRKKEEGEMADATRSNQIGEKGLAYISMEDSVGFWFRFWREHTGNRTWTGLKEAMVLWFGGRNQGPVFERLATSKQSGIMEEYDQPLNGKELLEPNGSNARGLPEPNSSRLLDPNVRGLPEPNDSGLTDSNVRGLSGPNDSGLTNSNLRGLSEANGSGLMDSNVREQAEPKEKGPTEPNGRGRTELNVRKLAEPNGLVMEGRMKGLEGRADGRINALERTKNSLKWWAIEKNRGLVVFDTPAEGRERREVLKDIEDHFLKTCDSGERVNRILNEEWKTLEEVLPPPKPPDLNWRTTVIEYRAYDNARMERSQEIKFHSSNLEDKVVLQWGVMLGAGIYMIRAGKCRRGRGIGEKEKRIER
ncbi:hypothetical protein V8G54_035031 [Vigna mungo]|uniref:Uncharacterized protein n=1 Tax=Vigna mungo TaxID=3915 RepID=A0AAQ3RE46_VIGMU